MKRVKSNKGLSQASKISDFFAKVSSGSETDNKRKHDTLEVESQVLNSLTNLTNIHGQSPTRKRIKQGENHSLCADFQVVTPEKGLRPSSSMRTPRSKTPQSGKKGTPKKLFERSPRSLETFNVQVLETFVQVSPSTSGQKVCVHSTPCKVYLQSPVLRSGSGKARDRASTTPQKSPICRTKLTYMEGIDVLVKKEEENEEEDPFNNSFKFEFEELLKEELKLEEVDNLNLNEPQHCTVTEVQQLNGAVTLRLKSKNGGFGTCSVEQFWASNTPFAPGNTLFVCAERINNKWVVNNNHGWIIYEPDLLIPCTTVVGSLFCKRKAVLSDRYRGFESSNKIMTIGTLAHTLLQQTLRQKLATPEEISTLLKTILGAKDTVKRLYETNLTVEELESDLQIFIPKLVSFIREYVKCESTPEPQNWQGKICDIDDIEENVWCLETGTKGKIDVTVRTESGVMPLELKTGRATVSLEHRGQVMLYIMMMNKFGYQVASGLLLYLREGVLKEVKATPQEQRDIMLLRNELAYFLLKNTVSDVKKAPELPEPLSNHRICSKCPYNIICTSYINYENHDIAQNKSIQEVQKAATGHLVRSHLDYFLLWSNLLSLEEESNRSLKPVKDIYTVPPSKREASGRCIVNVRIAMVEAGQNGLYEHTFQKEQPAFNFIACDIVENNYVVVSTNSRPAVATGFVTRVSVMQISVLLDRNLEKKYGEQPFHLDTYDSNVTFSFNMSSLALLLEDTPRAAELRSTIIDKSPPTFVSKLPVTVAKKGAVILKRLNVVQQKAVLKALCANEFLLIKGMPGTGKSATIVALIQLLVELNKNVLLTSHTHSAIDNICIRLLKRRVDFLRLGSESKIDPGVKSNSEATLLENCSTPQEMEEIYNKYQVVAVTCLGSSHHLLSRRVFDVCIVDESTQVVQTSVVRALCAAKTFVLIGDPNQLAPVVKNRKASQEGMSESLFERLENPEGTITLNLNYRMNKTITDLANVLTYNGELKTGNEEVANRTLKITDFQAVRNAYGQHPWLLKALDVSLEAAVQVIDTGPVWKQPVDVKWQLKNFKIGDSDLQNCVNVHEVAIVVTVVKALIKGGVDKSDIGVIATYRAQVAQISNFLQPLEVDVSTVDQFQGRDKGIVVFSCTKSTNTSTEAPKSELLEDNRRLTVAITRAKRKLIIVGDVGTLERFSPFAKIFPALRKHMIKFDSAWSLVNEV